MPTISARRLWTILGATVLALALSVGIGSASVRGVWPYEITLLGAEVLISCLLLLLPKKFVDRPKVPEKGKPRKIHTLLMTAWGQKTFFYLACACVMALFFLLRFMWGHDYLENVSGLTSVSFMNPFSVATGSLFLCYQATIVFFLLGHEFLPTPRTDAIVKWLCAPVLLLSIVFMPNLIRGMIGDTSGGLLSPRGFFFAIELAFELAFCLKTWLEHPSLKLSKDEGYALAVAFTILFIVSINDYLPKNLIGEKISNVPTAKSFSWTHRIFIYLTFILPVLYYALLYPLDYSHRRFYLFIIASGTLFAYASLHRYDTWTSVPSLPLHLCNTAMYIMPLTLAFKNYPLFYFTMFVNVIGAFFALLMPNFSSARLIFANQTFEFYINHMYAAFMPVLIILLGIYERPKWKYFLYSMVGFLLYFVLVCSIDIYYAGQGISGVDFFFLSSDFIPDKLGTWAENVYKAAIYSFTSGGHTYQIRVAYLTSFFFTYVGLSIAMWFVYEVLFVLVDQVSAIKDKAKCRKDRKASFLAEANHPILLVASVVTKTYPCNVSPSLIDFSLSLKPGKIYGFLGNNGAGKSTFIKAAVGLHDFKEGSIKICGYDIEFETEKAKMRMAYVPDHYALEESLTGHEYVSYMASLYKVDGKKAQELTDRFVPLLSLQDVYDEPMHTYSHGMKQKITLLGALVHSPDIIILDEPLTGVDPESVYEIKKVMREHARRGNCVFFSSHIIDLVENLCDEVIIIKKGEMVARTETAALKRTGVGLEDYFLSSIGVKLS